MGMTRREGQSLAGPWMFFADFRIVKEGLPHCRFAPELVTAAD
jgi:hypothetical protein